MPGKLIVIDGLDGSGKTTQHSLAVESLLKRNINAMGISFPNYDEPSSALIKMYLGGEFGKNPSDVNAYAASSFYAVDRYAGYKKFWESFYSDGGVVVAARYTSSNMFHQMCKLPEREWDSFLQWIEDYEYVKLCIPKPDTVIFLDMDPLVSRQLISKRYGGNETKRDVHEQNFEYLLSCRKAALYASDKLGFSVVSCSENGKPYSVDETQKNILRIVLEAIGFDRI